MTHNVTSPPSINAVRKIIRTPRLRLPEGKAGTPAGKRPSLVALGPADDEAALVLRGNHPSQRQILFGQIPLSRSQRSAAKSCIIPVAKSKPAHAKPCASCAGTVSRRRSLCSPATTPISSDTILGLQSGANDYVTKPFRFAVLLGRILRPASPARDERGRGLRDRPYRFRPRSKLLLNPIGNKVRLTEKETSILRYLHRAGQQPVSRETLLREVWGYNSGSHHAHARDAHLSITAKDREGCRRSGHPGH